MNLGKKFKNMPFSIISEPYTERLQKHLVTNLTPNIIEERPMNVAVMDVYSRLMMDRIIFLGYPINDEVANIITAQLLFLESTDRTRDIQMYINSPGWKLCIQVWVFMIPCNMLPRMFHYMYRDGCLHGRGFIVPVQKEKELHLNIHG